MSGHKRQWVVVVLIYVGLLTLYTANGHPYLQRNPEIGIRDDPAEMMPLSLVERDAADDEVAGGPRSSKNGSNSNGNVTIAQSNTYSVSLRPQQTPSLSTFHQNLATVTSNKTSVLKTALPQNLTIIATTAVATGIALGLTSTRSASVNMNKTNSSRTLQNAPKNSSIILATSANELKPSFTRHPTGSLSLNMANGVSNFDSALTPNPRTTVLATKSAQSSAVVRLNPSKSTYSVPIMQPTITSSLYLKIIPTSSAGLQNVPPSVIFSSAVVQSNPVYRSSVAASQKASLSITTPKLGAFGTSTQNPSESTSTQKPSVTSSTEIISKGVSSVGPKVPSTQVLTSANTKPTSQTSEKLPSTKKQTTLQSTPQGSSSPPTKEITVPESTSSVGSSVKPTTKLTTTKSTAMEGKKPSTKGTSSAPSTSETPTTVPKKPTPNMELKTTKESETKATSKVTTKEVTQKTTNTKPKTTKEVTQKMVATEKTTAENAKISNQKNGNCHENP